LRVVGHMTKELLKLETLKNIENVCKIVWDENGQTNGCATYKDIVDTLK
jgi:hypothetical protein